MSYFIKPPRFRSSLFSFAACVLKLPSAVTAPFLFETGTAPYFDDDVATDWFLKQLSMADRYLEYGSGGTTFAAAKMGKAFFSKESDVRFYQSVAQTIKNAGLSGPDQQLVHANIGLTASWGFPAGLRQPDAKRLAQFDAYSDFPENGPSPNLVLIDGRFRVACFLKAVKALNGAQDCTIIIDDYADRPFYHSVEQFVPKAHMVGRMAVFKPTPIADMDALERHLDAYRYDTR